MSLLRFLLIFAMMTVSLGPRLQADDEDKAFVFQGTEQVAYLKCQANFGRGQGCSELMHRLCSRIANKNVSCVRLLVEECQDEHWTDQTDDEAKCKLGQHVEPCYGVHATCSTQEEAYCKRTKYGDRYCPYYHWIACRKESGGAKTFVSQDCRIFAN